jgi:hypothetical protein
LQIPQKYLSRWIKAGKALKGQLHHIIPLELVKKNKYIAELVDNGWDIHKLENGIDLTKGFHTGRHTSGYTEFVENRINNYARRNKSTLGLENYIEKELIPEMKTLLRSLEESYKTTGDNINTAFKKINNLMKK